ncbi:hypothetical protein GCM10011415_28250 [Salipiger pallidus]|uniref:Uncharacterized protein n=1 Tax=Salipiger pallidus TaxID=1775170 RepID=A0A8J2ZLL0_9RHOB|nr:AsnC family protein [Salipiger pallidus]GGG77686.1 hypothetical protein GCM10011415_28250 [Salipiger pallidus]
MSWGEKKHKVLRALRSDPRQPVRTIAADLGVSASYVRAVKSRSGITAGEMSPENLLWLKSQAARDNLTVPQLLNGLVTDARLEAEEVV